MNTILQLEAAEGRISKVEECDCVKSCDVNGTLHADGASWERDCDICACVVSTFKHPEPLLSRIRRAINAFMYLPLTSSCSSGEKAEARFLRHLSFFFTILRLHLLNIYFILHFSPLHHSSRSCSSISRELKTVCLIVTMVGHCARR